LVYEIQMFCILAKGIDLIERSKIPTQIKDDATKNVILKNDVVKYALLESFLIHARNIIKFLSKKRKASKHIKCYDMHYQDILENSENIGPFINDEDVKHIKDGINNEIAHLSKCRVLNEKTQWSIQEVVCELVPGIEKFMNEIENRKVDFDENYKKEIEDEIDELEKSFCENESNENHSPVSTTTSTLETHSAPYINQTKSDDNDKTK